MSTANDSTPNARDDDTNTPITSEPIGDGRTVRENVVAREKEQYGGFKFGSAFFGWLTATGTVVLLTALVAGAGAALGLGSGTTAEDVSDAAQANAETIGIVGAISVVVILFVAYYCGGYVAGRMARFSGAKQGLAVWLWAVVIAIVVAIVGALAGSQYNVLANLDTFPRIPVNEGDLTAVGIITAILAILVSLGGAVLGGLAGMRYHRNVDRAGLGR
jgi:polyferredoxin